MATSSVSAAAPETGPKANVEWRMDGRNPEAATADAAVPFASSVVNRPSRAQMSRLR